MMSVEVSFLEFVIVFTYKTARFSMPTGLDVGLMFTSHMKEPVEQYPP